MRKADNHRVVKRNESDIGASLVVSTQSSSIQYNTANGYQMMELSTECHLIIGCTSTYLDMKHT